MVQVLRAKLSAYNDIGCHILVSDNQFAIVVLTPIMLRSHETQESAGLCFVDSTASCDAQNHTVTFMLAPCAAGAVPLAVLITQGQAESDYVAAFRLLRDHGGVQFGGVSYPQIFITDDSTAEQNSLAEVWPESDQKLCLFHVPQANWRWLWDATNNIAKNDRPVLMAEFRNIMLAANEVEAEANFEESQVSTVAKKYPAWCTRVKNYWDRKERWCMAWRSAVHRGHHTNNYSEITVRLFKDIVLLRAKAYNCVALVDFVCTTMEQYYMRRLLDFAHSRNSTSFTLLNSQLKKASYVSPDAIQQTSETTFEVPSEADPLMTYTVEGSIGVCSCHDGVCGKFCKHQAAVMLHKQGTVQH